MPLMKPQEQPQGADWISKWNRYATMAGAMGLATGSVQAGIRLYDPSPDPVLQPPGRPATAYLYFDFADGTVSSSFFSGADFRLLAGAYRRTFSLSSSNLAQVISNSNNNEVALTTSGYAQMFGAGEIIGPSRAFGTGDVTMAVAWSGLVSSSTWSSSGTGPWVGPGPQRGYLGLRFQMNGNTHYGWADVTVENEYPQEGLPKLTLHRFAYETEPDTPIQAGAVPEPAETATAMGLLALGAAGLARYRRRRTAATQPAAD
ncbi:MAG: hypothetical protein D6766_14740 [Verrucomicrobia bacterium]|nr:MAG: hypothetical protein D6766_14740 [Verrucomicrobiota bacterium]